MMMVQISRPPLLDMASGYETKGHLAVAVVICFVWNASVYAQQEGEKCSRPHSRAVREVVQSGILAIVDQHGYVLPEACVFHPARDMQLKHEQSKERIRSRTWKCNLCNKTFRSEHWLDLHFDRKHSSGDDLSEVLNEPFWP